MEQQFKIMISSRTIHKEFELPDYKKQVKIGTTSACEFRLNPDLFFDSISLEIQKKDSVREISCSDNLFLKKDELRKFTVSEISHGDAFSVCYADSGIEVFKLKFMIDFDTMVLDFSWGLDLSGRNELTIGGDSRCDLVIDSPFTQNSTAVLTRRGNSFVLKELQSPYGIAVNGKKILQPELLWDMDFFSISDFSFYYKRQHLYFDRNRITDHTREIFRITPESSFRYPLFIRNTRVKYQSDTSPIPVLNPSPKPAPPKVNVVTTLMPTLAMFALVVVLRGFMSSSGGTYVIFSICSMGLAMAIRDIKNAHKMGCRVVREQFLIGAENFIRLAPYAEAYGIKVGIEIHNPDSPVSPMIMEYREKIENSGSEYLGFLPDFGCFATKPNKMSWDDALKAGGNEKLLEMARDMRYEGKTEDEAGRVLSENGATNTELSVLRDMYGFLQFKKDISKELQGLKDILPYCFHMHGKYHYLSEELVEASIPYPEIMQIVKDSDYSGYIVSEYERYHSDESIEMLSRHLKMMKQYVQKK